MNLAHGSKSRYGTVMQRNTFQKHRKLILTIGILINVFDKLLF